MIFSPSPPTEEKRSILRNNHLSSSGNNRARTKSPSVYTAGHARSKRVTAVEILFGLQPLKPEKSLLNILENIGFRKMERLGFQESCFSLLIRAPFPLSALYIVVVAIKRLWIPWYDTWCYLLGSIYPPWFRSARAILIIML